MSESVYNRYRIIRSARRSVSLTIDGNGEITVQAPYLIPRTVLDHFVASKSGWIGKHLKQIQPLIPQPDSGYKDGRELLYLGNRYKLRFGNYREINVTTTFNVPAGMRFRAEKEIRNWFIHKAKIFITQRTAAFAETMSVTFRGIRFSDTTSKWGTCTHDNRLQFSWRLIMAPALVIDYVIVHELAHVTEKNHRRGFWNIVGKYKPAYKQYKKWLKDNSRLIHAQI